MVSVVHTLIWRYKAQENSSRMKVKVCLWIKKYTHPLRVLGGVFFGAAILAGILWSFGKDIEPIAFLLGLLSSMFLASPSVAEYFLPDRKPVRHMDFDEIVLFIPTTNPLDDWHGITRELSSEYFLKEDPRLRFRVNYLEEGTHNSDFREEWANCHPNPRACSYWCELYYDGSLIDRTILVSVDGGRALLPLPEVGTNEVSEYQYLVAQIHDVLGSLDKYMKRSKLHVTAL